MDCSMKQKITALEENVVALGSINITYSHLSFFLSCRFVLICDNGRIALNETMDNKSYQ